MRAKYARTIRAGIELARMGWRGDAIIPAYIENPLILRAFSNERQNMARNRVRLATSRRVSALEPFRVQRDARTSDRASDARKWFTGALMCDKGEQR